MDRRSLTSRAERRAFLRNASAASGVLLAGCAHSAVAKAGAAADEAEVSPAEDLMAEHGILQRVLLVYDELVRRIQAGTAVDPQLAKRAAEVVKTFIEDYHERTEEQHVFPRLERAGRELPLVGVLRVQHEAGRALTARILGLDGSGDQAPLAEAMSAFTRMYRPHAAREDTVLFPAFRQLLGRAGYRELGEEFEEEEHRRFGEDGYRDYVRKVLELEQALGIADLSQFTPS